MGGCVGGSCVGGSCDSVTLVLATSGLEELLRAKWEGRGIGGGKMGREGGECGGGDRKGEREADKDGGDKEGGRKGEEEGEKKKMGSEKFKPSLQMAHSF